MKLKTVSYFWDSKVPVPKISLCEAEVPQNEVLFSNLPLKLGQSRANREDTGSQLARADVDISLPSPLKVIA